MKRTIQISSPICKKLMDTYHVSRQTVWRAMSYQRNNLLSRKLRCMALTLGGHAVVTAPEIETLWDHKGTMTQFFPNGVKMLLIKASHAHPSRSSYCSQPHLPTYALRGLKD